MDRRWGTLARTLNLFLFSEEIRPGNRSRLLARTDRRDVVGRHFNGTRAIHIAPFLREDDTPVAARGDDSGVSEGGSSNECAYP